MRRVRAMGEFAMQLKQNKLIIAAIACTVVAGLFACVIAAAFLPMAFGPKPDDRVEVTGALMEIGMSDPLDLVVIKPSGGGQIVYCYLSSPPPPKQPLWTNRQITLTITGKPPVKRNGKLVMNECRIE